jgi:hypothetical protein
MNKAELNQMSIDQLRELNSMVVSMIKDKRRILANNKKCQIYVGAHVKVDHDKLRNEKCYVDKINRTRCEIRVEGRLDSYNVPISMLTLDK